MVGDDQRVRVWVVYTDAGMGRIGVFGIATDEQRGAKVREAAERLHHCYGGRDTPFRAVARESWNRDDERVYRSGSIAVIARPFMLDVTPARDDRQGGAS